MYTIKDEFRKVYDEINNLKHEINELKNHIPTKYVQSTFKTQRRYSEADIMEELKQIVC